jgi:hypothetical protein
MAGLQCVNKEISRPTIILALVENGFPHAVNILLSLVLALLEIDVRHHLAPSRLLVYLPVLLSQPLLLLGVILSSFPFLPVLPVLVLLELS